MAIKMKIKSFICDIFLVTFHYLYILSAALASEELHTKTVQDSPSIIKNGQFKYFKLHETNYGKVNQFPICNRNSKILEKRIEGGRR